jgi:hypothetical protein
MPRKLHRLSARYIRGARVIEIHNPHPHLIEISGENGAGKSSAMDCLEWGIRGKRALPDDPLHHGATKGYTRVNLGDIEIERRLTESNAARGGTTKITAADGSKWGEKDIEQIWGAWTFDPQAFAAMRPEDRVAACRRLAGAEFCAELARLETALDSAAAARTEAGRDLARYGEMAKPAPVEPVDVGQLMVQLNDIRAHNKKQEDAARAKAAAKTEVERVADEVERLKLKLADAEARLAKLDSALGEMADPDELRDESELTAALAEAGARNRAAMEYEQASKRYAAWKATKRQHTDLQTKVDDLAEKRRQHLRTATLPMGGLSWEGGDIALHGTPFGGLCTTEQLLLSARIGMAMSPDLRVMLIRQGGLIDKTQFQALLKLAEEEDYQLIIETAGEGHTKDALVIVDGELRDGGEG